MKQPRLVELDKTSLISKGILAQKDGSSEISSIAKGASVGLYFRD